MRPRYETSEDLKNERDIADFIEKKYKLILRKMPDRYFIDFMAFRENGTPVAVIETKRRRHSLGKYDTIFLSLAKWNHGRQFHHENHIPFAFIVALDDGIYKYKYESVDACGYDNKSLKIKWGGRDDRGDGQDLEPMVHIPIGRLEKLE
jgi:hypothetical protein